jgi:hypothetical protein
LETVNGEEEDVQDEDEGQGPRDAKRAVLKPEGEPLQTEHHDAEQFVQLGYLNPIGLLDGTV